MGLTNPLTENDLKEFVDLYTSKKESLNSWSKNINDVDKETWSLKVYNPNRKEKIDNRTPKEIAAEIEELDSRSKKSLQIIKELL